MKLPFWALLLLAGAKCYRNITVGELPKEVVDDMRTLSTQKKLCTRLKPVQADLLLYTRGDNADLPLDAISSKDLDAAKKTIVLVHGWLSGPSSVRQLKDAYLRRYDCNVLVVDWSRTASKSYTEAACHVQKVAYRLAKFFCGTHLSLADMHVVGHSMGGQIAGVAASFVATRCQKQLGRITGLDPSGPLFQNLPEARRLDSSDAKFVDVIHTDQLRFGYSGNVGHVDFHPNCGQIQPGCRQTTMADDVPLSELFCSHDRSLVYMTESIHSNDFVAVSCGMCPRACRPNVINAEHVVMGEDFRGIPGNHNKFFLCTGSSSPYALGWSLQDAKLP